MYFLNEKDAKSIFWARGDGWGWSSGHRNWAGLESEKDWMAGGHESVADLFGYGDLGQGDTVG